MLINDRKHPSSYQIPHTKAYKIDCKNTKDQFSRNCFFEIDSRSYLLLLVKQAKNNKTYILLLFNIQSKFKYVIKLQVFQF